MKITTSMKGFQNWMKKHPKRNLNGYFNLNGKPMTHEQVVKVVNYAVEKGYETEADIPSEDLIKLFGKEGDEK